jgi:predicted Zn-dependent peptidase
MGLIDQILAQGQDSRLYERLVQKKGITSGIESGINAGLGNMFDYNGPMLWTTNLIYDSTVTADDIVKEFDEAIADLGKNVSAEDLQLASVKMRSGLYEDMGSYFGVGKINLLACFALFDDNPARINTLEAEFKKITPALIRKTVQQYLIPSNRTILVIQPKAS